MQCTQNAPTLSHNPLILTYLQTHLRRYVLIRMPSLLSSFCQSDYAASVLAVLKRFGYDVENLNGPEMHSLCNVMTLQKDVHEYFDRLEIWFEETVSVACLVISCPHWPP